MRDSQIVTAPSIRGPAPLPPGLRLAVGERGARLGNHLEGVRSQIELWGKVERKNWQGDSGVGGSAEWSRGVAAAAVVVVVKAAVEVEEVEEVEEVAAGGGGRGGLHNHR